MVRLPADSGGLALDDGFGIGLDTYRGCNTDGPVISPLVNSQPPSVVSGCELLLQDNVEAIQGFDLLWRH
jgi:hypothetical protein